MTQSMVTKTETDLLPLFQAAARGAREADEAGRHAEREIHYATLEAIDEAAVTIDPTDIQNALLRLGIAKYFLDRVYDHSCRDLDIGDEINKIDKLISGAARVIVRQSGIDVNATELDFYRIGTEAVQ